MTFLHAGLAAAGLACVSIPIIIHLLLRRRRRPIEWAAMRFVIEAYKRQRNKLRLQHLILLVARCLVVALLALALGRPVLEAAGVLGGGGRDVYLLIDNGIASGVRGGDGVIALDRHKEVAKGVLGALSGTDRASVIGLGGSAEVIVGSPSSDLDAIARVVDGMGATDSRTDVRGGIAHAANIIAREGADARGSRRVDVVVVSDFLEGSGDAARALSASLAELSAETGAAVRLLATRVSGEGAGNVQVIDVRTVNPVVLTGSGGVSKGEVVRVGLRRTGRAVGEEMTSTVRVRSGGSVAQTTRVRWRAGQAEAVVSLAVDASGGGDGSSHGGQVIEARIDRDALDADNVFRMVVGVREALRVGVIARRRFGGFGRADEMGAAEWLALALRPSEGEPIDTVEIEPAGIDGPTLASVDVVFVAAGHLVSEEGWRLIGRFARGGGLVVLMPSAGERVHQWPDAAADALGLDWEVAREVEELGDGGVRLAPGDDGSGGDGLLSQIGAELGDLVKPVRVNRMVGVVRMGTGFDAVISLQDGRPWVIAGAPGTEQEGEGASERGLVVYMASAPVLSWTDLPARPLMVPLVQEIVRRGYGVAAGSWSFIAGGTVSAPVRSTRLEVVEGGGGSIGLNADGVTSGVVRGGGVWRAVDASGRERGLVAVNPDADGGKTGAQAESVVEAWLAGALGEGGSVEWIDAQDPGAAVRSGEARTPWSRPLLIAALVLALLETGFARWFSYGGREEVVPVGDVLGGVVAGGRAA